MELTFIDLYRKQDLDRILKVEYQPELGVE